MISIINAGADIAQTNYWDSDHAEAGLCYLSGNAGAWRLLVPEVAEGMLIDMRTGTNAVIEPSINSEQCWDIVFDNGTDTPFSLAIDKRQVDRAMEPGCCVLTVWTQRGKQLDLSCRVDL